MNNIERMEVLTGNETSKFGSRGVGGVILLYSKKGGDALAKSKKPLSNLTINAIDIDREFYNSKVDDTTTYKGNSNSVLYWNPNIQIKNNKTKEVSFYVKKEVKNIQVIIDALAEDGTPAYYIKQLSVK